MKQNKGFFGIKKHENMTFLEREERKSKIILYYIAVGIAGIFVSILFKSLFL